MTVARHAAYGPTRPVTWTQWTTPPQSPARAVWQLPPGDSRDPAVANRLAVAAHREVGDVAELLARLESRCDRLTAGLIAVAAVAVFAAAALVFTWLVLLHP